MRLAKSRRPGEQQAVPPVWKSLDKGLCDREVFGHDLPRRDAELARPVVVFVEVEVVEGLAAQRAAHGGGFVGEAAQRGGVTGAGAALHKAGVLTVRAGIGGAQVAVVKAELAQKAGALHVYGGAARAQHAGVACFLFQRDGGQFAQERHLLSFERGKGGAVPVEPLLAGAHGLDRGFTALLEQLIDRLLQFFSHDHRRDPSLSLPSSVWGSVGDGLSCASSP